MAVPLGWAATLRSAVFDLALRAVLSAGKDSEPVILVAVAEVGSAAMAEVVDVQALHIHTVPGRGAARRKRVGEW